MSSEPPKMEAPTTKPPWDKVDPILKRTALCLTIVVTSLALINNFVIPFWEVFLMVVPQAAYVAWNVRNWRKDKGYLVGWWIQPLFVFQLGITFTEAGIHFSKGDAYNRLLGVLWLCASVAWTTLLVLAAREQHNAIREEQKDLWNALLKISTTQVKVIDKLENLANTQHELAKVQEQIIKGNAAHADLVKLYHEESTSPAVE